MCTNKKTLIKMVYGTYAMFPNENSMPIIPPQKRDPVISAMMNKYDEKGGELGEKDHKVMVHR